MAIPVDLFRQHPLHWVAISTDRFVLDLGHGWVALEGQQDYWDVVMISPSGARQLLASKSSLGDAQKRAEDDGRRTGAGGVTNAHAQRRPITAVVRPKASGKMRYLHIPIQPGMTIWQISDLIDQAQLRKRLVSIEEGCHG